MPAASRLQHRRVLFLICPTGAYCREDRCQSAFSFELVPSMRPPMEECEAAGAVRAAGATPFVIDAPAEGLGDAETLARVRAIGPDLVVLTTTFGTLESDLAWLPRLAELLPGVTLGLRGAPCFTDAAGILARSPALHFCVQGEYELVFAAVVRDGYEAAPGALRLGEDGGAISAGPPPMAGDLDALPRPDRSVIDPGLYRVRGTYAPQATVRVQRGCPYPCTYCLVHTVSGKKARHRSPESVADEMAEVMAGGSRWFYLRADTFTVDKKWALATAEAIARRAPGARWVTTTREDRVDDEVIGAMARAGCYGLSFGIDAASEAVGAQVRKPPQPERAAEAMRLCDRHGILSLAYIMIGFVWDTPETLAETARFAAAIRPDLLTIHYAHPYPGTVYHQQVGDAPLHSRRAQSEPATAGSGVSPAELEESAEAMRRRHYRDPRVLASIVRKSPSLGRALLSGIRWRVSQRA